MDQRTGAVASPKVSPMQPVWWLRPATKIKTDIKFDGGFEPWLIPATKIRIETDVKFDYGFKPLAYSCHQN